MTDYCTVTLESWEPDSDPNKVVEYLFHDPNCDYEQLSPSPSPSVKPHLKDHFQFGSVASLDQHRLQVTKHHSDTSEESKHCWMTFECKPEHGFAIGGLGVASEAHNIEVYDAKNSKYLQHVRGTKDIEDSEADNSKVHFMCHCAFEEPKKGIKIKFLSLGLRESFEIARVRLILETCDTQSELRFGETINIEKLKKDIDDMGTISDQAKAFLETLENFQKSKQGTLDDMRHVLLDKNRPASADGRTMPGMTTLLSMFANSPAMGSRGPAVAGSQTAEGSMVNNMLSQMMGSLAVLQQQSNMGAGPQGEGMYQFLQSVCGQVSQIREEDEQKQQQPGSAGDTTQAQKDTTDSNSEASVAAQLENKIAAKIEAVVDARLEIVEKHITQQVDKRFEEIQQHMDSKLDAILALMQQKKS